MRIRLLGAVAALIGCAAVATAQTAPPMPVPGVPPAPTAAPPGMTALPPSSLPAMPAAPPVMVSNTNCGTPAASACHDGKHSKGGGLLGKFGIGVGTANPVSCGCLASERTFLFGGCKQFFTPGRTCNGSALDYGAGCGGACNQDNCKHVTSFLNR